jgi:hypothetical protein
VSNSSQKALPFLVQRGPDVTTQLSSLASGFGLFAECHIHLDLESQPPRRKDTRKKVNHGDTESTEKMSLHANAYREFSVLSVSPW